MDVREMVGMLEGVVRRRRDAVGAIGCGEGVGAGGEGRPEEAAGRAGRKTAEAPTVTGVGEGPETEIAAGREREAPRGEAAGKRARGLSNGGGCSGVAIEAGEIGATRGSPRVRVGRVAGTGPVGLVCAGSNLLDCAGAPPVPSISHPTADGEDDWAAESMRVATELLAELGRMFAEHFPVEPTMLELPRVD